MARKPTEQKKKTRGGGVARVTMLLSSIYHHVLERTPSPEAAKLAINKAWRGEQLQLWATQLHEYAAPPAPVMPVLWLEPGKPPPMVQPAEPAKELLPATTWPNHPIAPDVKFDELDWESSEAYRRDSNTASLFHYADIVGDKEEVLKLWPAEAPQRRRPGRKPKHNWPELVAQELLRMAVNEGNRLDNDADLIGNIQDFLDKEIDWHPQPKELRPVLAKWLARVRRR
jgi:hypothetical protein